MKVNLPYLSFKRTNIDDYKQFDKVSLFTSLCNSGKPSHSKDHNLNDYDSSFDSMDSKLLEEKCNEILNYDNREEEVESVEHSNTVDFLLNNINREQNERIIMPLPWNNTVSSHLAMNFKLAKSVLYSNKKKLSDINGGIQMYDDVIKEQYDSGVIEKISNIKSYIDENPNCSFLAHMGVFKLDRDTTKLRVVYLSNLCESSRDKSVVSHNQAIRSGPCLNHKIATALMLLRFDKYLLTFDIKKAFLNIALPPEDQNRLLFLWFNDIQKNDFTLVAYKNLRLTFGLRSSPCMLMLSLFKILILDAVNDSEDIAMLKREIFHTIYMDNGGYSCDDENKLWWAYENIPKIFAPYQFHLQQFNTNCTSLEKLISEKFTDDKHDQLAKLLGIVWDKEDDSIYPLPINLDTEADTRRKVLQTLNSIYDLFNVCGPVLNRAKLFLQKVQLSKDLNWDTKFPKELQHEWRKISKQANSTPLVKLNRCLGSKTDDYNLVAFTDASKLLYGVVIYLLNNITGSVSYLLSKTRVVNSAGSKKTIPALELQAIHLGVETLIAVYSDMCGDNRAVLPLKIHELLLFSDSMVAIHWLQTYAVKFDKMQKLSTFVRNRLDNIGRICETKAVKFNFIEGMENPADHLTRTVSYNRLVKTTFYVGPEILKSEMIESDISAEIPNPNFKSCEMEPKISTRMMLTTVNGSENVLSLDRYSSFAKLVRVYKSVFRFIKIMKESIVKKFPHVTETKNPGKAAFDYIIRAEQAKSYPELNVYFSQPKNKTIPALVERLNLQIDRDGIVRVKCKLREDSKFPILLSQKSFLTRMIIRETHQNLAHGGVYCVLRELRSKFYIPCHFSTVKRELKNCVICQRYNGRCVKINTNSYRDFRLSPSQRPYGTVFMDYMGPFDVKTTENSKVWVLVVSCLWSRSINLKICLSADVHDFLRALQIHIYEYGNFSFCRSDLGSQLTAGSKRIDEMLKTEETKSYLQEHGIKEVEIGHYPKGNSSLGSLVESSVKQTKLLINKSIRKNILMLPEFELLLAQVKHLVNRRPIAFKEALRGNNLPEPITPEILVKGYELPVVTIIPELCSESSDLDEDFKPTTEVIRRNFNKLKKVRNRAVKLYHEEFLGNLISQATNKTDRYKRTNHSEIKPGDIVLLVEDFTKRSNYRMGLVLSVEQ